MLHEQCPVTVTSVKASLKLNKKPKAGLNRLPLVKPELAYALWQWNRMNSCLVPYNLHLVNHYAFLSLGSIAQTSQNPQAHDNLSASLQGYGLLFPPLALLLGSSTPQGPLVTLIPSEGLKCWFGKERSGLPVKVGSLHVLELTDTCWTVSLFLKSI